MDTVATVAGATRATERGWRGFVLALALVLAFALLAFWPPALGLLAGTVGLLAPLPEPLGLLTGGIAACAVAAWTRGGRGAMAIVWTALAIWSAVEPVGSATPDFDRLTRGWSLTVVCAFGLAHLVAVGRRFLSRALVAVGVASVLSLSTLALRDTPVARVTQLSERAVGARVGATMGRWRQHLSDPVWLRFAKAQPDLAERAYAAGRAIERGVPVAARLAPALAALETLLILGVAWSAFHRVSRVRVGAPLSSLGRFRFNDQLIWGVVVGSVLTLLPAFAEWRGFGQNLLLFFGALYALRGTGVLLGWASDRAVAAGAVAALLLAPFLGAPVVLAVVGSVALVLGVTDTWRDWRGLNAPR